MSNVHFELRSLRKGKYRAHLAQMVCPKGTECRLTSVSIGGQGWGHMYPVVLFGSQERQLFSSLK